MTYSEHLGQTTLNIARAPVTLRTFQQAVQKAGQQSSPSPWPTVGPTSTFTPKTPTLIPTPPKTTTIEPKTTATITPTMKPVTPSLPVLLPKTSTLTVSGGASPTSPRIAVESGGMTGGFMSAFTSSPLMLIGIGLAALLLVSKKGR